MTTREQIKWLWNEAVVRDRFLDTLKGSDVFKKMIKRDRSGESELFEEFCKWVEQNLTVKEIEK